MLSQIISEAIKIKSILQLLFTVATISATVKEHFKFSHIQCTNRYEFRHELRQRFKGCEELARTNPLCGENFTIAYSNYPPYVYWNHHENIVDGILPEMVLNALESCCFGCNTVKYTGPFEHIDRFFREDVDFVMPVQTATSTESFFNHDYIHMIEVKGANFLGPVVKHDPEKMGRVITNAIFDTWPLFITAFIMSATAGVAIWLLDTHWNEGEFPVSFPRGPFEGFWWAFVSMTTVGYGDRSPKSVVARIFAVIWILIGITIFAMYTASLSSAFTSASIALHSKNLFQKNIAVLNISSIGAIATIKENSIAVGFETLEEITHAIMLGEVEGIALDDNMANYYLEELIEKGIKDLRLYKRVTISGCSYGMMSYNTTKTMLFKSFYDNNDDQREIMAKRALEDVFSNYDGEIQKQYTEGNIFFSSSSPIFPATVLILFAVAIITTTCGLSFKWISKKIIDKREQKSELAKQLLKSGVTPKFNFFDSNGDEDKDLAGAIRQLIDILKESGLDNGALDQSHRNRSHGKKRNGFQGSPKRKTINETKSPSKLEYFMNV